MVNLSENYEQTWNLVCGCFAASWNRLAAKHFSFHCINCSKRSCFTSKHTVNSLVSDHPWCTKKCLKMKKWFHGNIWTGHNWPAPNVSGFIAQLIEHFTGNCEVTGSNPVEVLNFFQTSLCNCRNCVHCDDHFFIFISFPQFIYDLFHILLTKKCLLTGGGRLWENSRK